MNEKERTELEKYIYTLLTRGAYTRFQLERKLETRTDDADLILELLDDCEKAGYVDDSLYAKLFVESREDWSKRRLVDELGRRGIDRCMAKRVVTETVCDERDRVAALAQAWHVQQIEPRKIAGRLSRRGFPEHLVREIVGELE